MSEIKAVRNNRPGVHLIGSNLLRLNPGLNLLDTPKLQKAWKEAKKLKPVILRLESTDRFPGGELQEIYEIKSKRVKNKVEAIKIEKGNRLHVPELDDDPDPDDNEDQEEENNEDNTNEKSIIKSIEGMSRRDVEILIADVDDKKLLKKYKKQTNDNVVKGKINRRIEELKED